MCATGDSAGGSHSIQKFLLILPWLLTRQLDLDVYGFAVLSMAMYIRLAVVANIHKRTVLCVELTYRVVSGDAAALTEGDDDFVLEDGFLIQRNHLQVFSAECTMCDRSQGATRTT